MAERDLPEFDAARRRLAEAAGELTLSLAAAARACSAASFSLADMASAARSKQPDRMKVFEVYGKACIENIRQRALRGLP